MRYSICDFAAARRCGAARSVAQDVIRRLRAGERVMSRPAAGGEWIPCALIPDPLRPRNPDGSDAPDSDPTECYAVNDGISGTVSASGGGFFNDHLIATEHPAGTLVI